VIDLGGARVAAPSGIRVSGEGTCVVFRNGTLGHLDRQAFLDAARDGERGFLFHVEDGATLVLDGVQLNCRSGVRAVRGGKALLRGSTVKVTPVDPLGGVDFCVEEWCCRIPFECCGESTPASPFPSRGRPCCRASSGAGSRTNSHLAVFAGLGDPTSPRRGA